MAIENLGDRLYHHNTENKQQWDSIESDLRLIVNYVYSTGLCNDPEYLGLVTLYQRFAPLHFKPVGSTPAVVLSACDDSKADRDRQRLLGCLSRK